MNKRTVIISAQGRGYWVQFIEENGMFYGAWHYAAQADAVKDIRNWLHFNKNPK